MRYKYSSKCIRAPPLSSSGPNNALSQEKKKDVNEKIQPATNSLERKRRKKQTPAWYMLTHFVFLRTKHNDVQFKMFSM